MDALPAGVGLMICLIPGLMCLSITKGHQALYEKFVMTEQLSTKMDKKQPHTISVWGLHICQILSKPRYRVPWNDSLPRSPSTSRPNS